jgi:glycosyltransferase involved in cell wall biosynthesis
MGKEKVSLVIFTLNEINGMKAVMPRIKKEWYDELVIVDGGSTDGTIEYAKEKSYFVFVQKEKGAGAAFAESMARVTGDIVVVLSPDGNSIPEKIPELTAKVREGYDIVIASRYYQGAKSYDDDFVTAFGNRMFTWLINILFRAKITDSLVMYRAFRTKIAGELHIDTRTVSWGSQLLIRALKKKMRIAEIPADEPPRIGGVRKMQPLKNGLSELRMILGEFFNRRY